MKRIANESRDHHFVPQFWLAGFTDTGKKDGLFWVTDFVRKKQWQCKPKDVGYRRDYYRADEPGVSDPSAIEKIYSKVESQVARQFKLFYKEKRGPIDDIELGTVAEYIAIQWTRLPIFRSTLDKTILSAYSASALNAQGAGGRGPNWMLTRADRRGHESVGLVDSSSGMEVTFSARPSFYIQQGTRFAEQIFDCLAKMRWHWIVSDSGSLLGSDNPIIVSGPPEEQSGGFLNAEIVAYPLNRYVLLFGTRNAVGSPASTPELIALSNTWTIRNADGQVYSHKASFPWLGIESNSENDLSIVSAVNFDRT